MTTEPPGGTDGGGQHRVGGRYELGPLLGRGGMAEVRKGRDLRLGRTVAVKRLRTDLASDPTFQARFRREAQSAASLNHPSIVAVYDTGDEPAEEGGPSIPYIVMEFVEGRTLRDIMREGRRILPERALEITAGVLSALDYSHRAGIVHRDIKPANVMLTPSGQVKVMDFGIARAVADVSATMTATAAVVGTAQYLSPEQARGEQVDSRSDLYSTGCLLYELLTGRPPFVGDSPVSVAYQHVREEPLPPSALDDSISPAIDAITAKALAKRTEDRYQSAAAMRADIERALAGQEVDAAPAAIPAAAAGYAAETDGADQTSFMPAAEEDEDRGPRRGRRIGYLILALVIIALFVLAAVFGPQLIGGSPQTRSVPDVTGMPLAKATQKLQASHLRLGDVTRRSSKDVRKGVVINQDPAAGTLLQPRKPVDLVVSSGKPTFPMPYVLGEFRADATQLLKSRGLKVDAVPRVSDAIRNRVIDTDPHAGSTVTFGQTVTIYYSKGRTTVPSVVGMHRPRAVATLTNAGLHYIVSKDPNAQAPRGIVTAQNPVSGTKVAPGATVVITVSDRPVEPTTPTQTTAPTTTPPTTPPTTRTPPTKPPPPTKPTETTTTASLGPPTAS